MPIRGQHTVHELHDLMAAYAFEQAALADAYSQSATAWAAADPASFAAWSAAWGNFQARIAPVWQRSQASEGAASATSTPSWDTVLALDTGGDVFDDLVTAWGDASATAPGLNTLDRELRATPAAHPYAPTYKGLPQPTAPDLDLAAYKLADRAVRWIEKSADHTLWYVAGGLLAWYLLSRRR
jgi:hypothetical protein